MISITFVWITLLFKKYLFDILIIIGIGTTDSALDEDGVLDIDTTISLETTWHAMEETVTMGLVRSIGIRLILCSFFFLFFFYRLSQRESIEMRTDF